MCAVGHQSHFSLDDFPPEALPAAEPSRALRIVRVGSAPLGKTQLKFNKLLMRIEKLRAERAHAVAGWETALSEYARVVHPLETRMHDLRRSLVRELAKIWRAPKGLGKRQRPMLRDLLREQFSFLEQYEPGPDDGDLRVLFDELEEDVHAEEKAHGDFPDRDVEVGADSEADDEGPYEGMDMSRMRPDMTPQEIMEEMARQMFEQGRAGGAKGRYFDSGPDAKPRKPTAAQLRKEQREAELEEARKRGVSTIYKQLAKVLHPDLEQDPARRAEKEQLMQELTVAYRAGDLHTLLRLELEFIHREQGDLNHLGEEKLKIYCELLAEQVVELERAVQAVPLEPRFAAIRGHVHPFYTHPPDWNGIASDLHRQLASIESSVAILRGPGAREEVRGALQAFAENRKRRSRRPIFNGFF